MIAQDAQLIATLRTEIDALNLVIGLLKDALASAQLGMAAAKQAFAAKDEVIAAYKAIADLHAKRADQLQAEVDRLQKWSWLERLLAAVVGGFAGYGLHGVVK